MLLPDRRDWAAEKGGRSTKGCQGFPVRIQAVGPWKAPPCSLSRKRRGNKPKKAEASVLETKVISAPDEFQIQSLRRGTEVEVCMCSGADTGASQD